MDFCSEHIPGTVCSAGAHQTHGSFVIIEFQSGCPAHKGSFHPNIICLRLSIASKELPGWIGVFIGP